MIADADPLCGRIVWLFQVCYQFEIFGRLFENHFCISSSSILNRKAEKSTPQTWITQFL